MTTLEWDDMEPTTRIAFLNWAGLSQKCSKWKSCDFMEWERGILIDMARPRNIHLTFRLPCKECSWATAEEMIQGIEKAKGE